MMQRTVTDAAPASEGTDAVVAQPTKVKPVRGLAKTQPVETVATVESTPAPVVAAASGGYYAQVGARNDQNQALAALADVQSKYGAVLGSYPPVIHTADLGAKGIWYRVRVGPIEDKDTANGLCEKLKGAGQKACMVVKE
jgi:cell division protein FtsN